MTDTAHVEWEPPNRSLAAHLQQTGLFHAVPDRELEDGMRFFGPGKPLCSYRGQLQPAPPALLAPDVTCGLCRHQVRRLDLTIAAEASHA